MVFLSSVTGSTQEKGKIDLAIRGVDYTRQNSVGDYTELYRNYADYALIISIIHPIVLDFTAVRQ